METVFEFEDGVLRVVTEGGSSGVIEEVDEMPISRFLQVGDFAILLLEPRRSWGTFQNLVKINRMGNVVWRAAVVETQSPPFEFCAIELDGPSELVAHTWSGHKVVIDVESGERISQEFVK